MIWLAIAALAIAAFVVLYQGPGRPFLRGHVGDAAACMLVYALLGLAVRARWQTRAALTVGLAFALELGQLVWGGRWRYAEWTIGNTFDAGDLIAYLAGTCVAVWTERRGAA
ncbi:MAG TPA: DUF2809 domain-containing protein [Kofleriaceae bacterium]|nr:DUF2809 domain-containing protein [Kofleriaceae bacterium]